MNSDLPKLSPEFLTKWDKCAEIMEIAKESYTSDVRILDGLYPLGIIHNPQRAARPAKIEGINCLLCHSVRQSADGRTLYETENFIVTPNKFPTIRGSSIAMHRRACTSDISHIGMYRTENLDNFESLMSEYLEVAHATGLQIFHNCPGAGASIPGHEHCNFHNFNSVYSDLNKAYGFDVARLESLANIPEVSELQGFPFAHLVFKEEPTRIKHFLAKLHDKIGHNFKDLGVPHTITQSQGRLLVVPVKVYIEGKGTGAGDVAGHLIARSEKEFIEANYDYCIKRLGNTLFRKDELDLVSLL